MTNHKKREYLKEKLPSLKNEIEILTTSCEDILREVGANKDPDMLLLLMNIWVLVRKLSSVERYVKKFLENLEHKPIGEEGDKHEPTN